MPYKNDNQRKARWANTPEKNGVTSKKVSSKTTGGSEKKGLPKSFSGYDVMDRKKVVVTEGIKKITMRNGRTALQGKSPTSGNTITHIIG